MDELELMRGSVWMGITHILDALQSDDPKLRRQAAKLIVRYYSTSAN